MQLSKEAAPRPSFLGPICRAACAGKEFEQAPGPTIGLNWLFYGRGNQPALFVQTCLDPKFVGNVRERFI